MTTSIITENTSAQNATGDLYSGVEDNNLLEQFPTFNDDSNGSLRVYKGTSGQHAHTLIRFTGLSNIPSTDTVTSATLYLRLRSGGGTGTYTIDLRRALQPWTAGGSTWETYDGTNAWDTDGCLGDGVDRVATVVGSVSVGTTDQYYGIDCTSLVQDIVDGTISSDEGFHIERADSGGDGNDKRFNSSDDPTTTQRPELVVIHEAGSAPTEIPPKLHKLDQQFSVIIANRLGGHIE